jgi:hypothetical protein
MVSYDYHERVVLDSRWQENNELLASNWWYPTTPVAIEATSYYGKDFSVGKSIMETCRWIGRFEQHAYQLKQSVVLIERMKVRLAICGHARCGDAQVRTAIIDRFGGSRSIAVGTKKHPGPLYGVSGHCWAALAVALTAAEMTQ